MKKKLGLINIISALIMLVILLVAKLSDYTLYFMAVTLLIGWAVPYFIQILNGIAIYKESHVNLAFTATILNTILLAFILFFVIKLFDKNFIVFLVEYIVMLVLNIINFIYLFTYKKKHPNQEKEEIKRKKKENNGAIV